MYQTLRTTIWLTLIGAGILAVIFTIIFSTDARAVLAAAAVVLIWVAWGILSSWLFGLKRKVVAHMKRPIDRVTFVTKDVGASRLADYVRTLEEVCVTQSGDRYGSDRYSTFSLLKTGNIALQLVDWTTIEAEDGELVNMPSNSVYLLSHERRPFVAKLVSSQRGEAFEHEDAWATGKGESLELCVESLEQANQIIRWLSEQTSRHSIYRGQMLQVASPQDGTVGQTIRMSKPPSADRDSIILPESIVALAERLVRGRHRHLRRLTRVGHKTRLGILLHGPPGTGKTLLTRYLIGSCQDHTVIVPTDMAVETLREAFRLANYLQPSILVIEDVDLLAPRRESNTHVDGLQELMNEMDGLNPASDTIVIMSTNRPEVLEPALASRPGRVSQTIEFPLPDEQARAELLAYFLRDTEAGSEMISEWAERTGQASPAFLEELCKRAILLAAERTDFDDDAPIQVQYGDLHNAIHELVVVGGDFTTKVLGFPSVSAEDGEFPQA